MMPILFIVAGILTIGGLVYSFQEKMIFFPEKLPQEYAFDFEGSSEFEEINFQTEAKISINALLFKAGTSAKGGLVLYFHGNAGSLHSWGYIAGDFTQKGFDILIIDYRGYGKSTGKINSEKGLHQDASFIYNKMRERYNEDEIVVYGRSIGTAIAAKVAAENNPKSLILESAYYNFIDLANHHYSIFPNSILLKYRLANNTYLPKVNCPVFLIHGTQDHIVPYESSVKLAQLSKNIKLTGIEGGGHNDLNSFQEYHIWLDRVLKIKNRP